MTTIIDYSHEVNLQQSAYRYLYDIIDKITEKAPQTHLTADVIYSLLSVTMLELFESHTRITLSTFPA